MSKNSQGAIRVLLDRQIPEDYREEWTSHVAKESVTTEAGAVSILIFRIGDEWLGLPTKVCESVSDIRIVHSLPHRRDGIVVGLTNVRGELVTCVSLGRLLGITAQERPEREHRSVDRKTISANRLLVLQRGTERLVAWTLEIHGTHRYHPRELREPPATLAVSGVKFSMGILPWGERSVGCLDEELVFHALGRALS